MKRQSELLEISIADAENLFSKVELQLIEEALAAREKAYAPYSNFKVGSAVLLENDQILAGNNQENAAYPSGLCAERVVLNFAKANNNGTAVKAIAVVTGQAHRQSGVVPVPCGACLQTMLETEQRQADELKIILIGKDRYYVAEGIRQFLPFQFNLNPSN